MKKRSPILIVRGILVATLLTTAIGNLNSAQVLAKDVVQSPVVGGQTGTKLTAKRTIKNVTAKRIKKGYAFRLKAKLSDGSKKITYKKISGCGYLKVSKNGKISVNKKLKSTRVHNGRHNIVVKVTGTDSHGKKISKKVKVSVRVNS